MVQRKAEEWDGDPATVPMLEAFDEWSREDFNATFESKEEAFWMGVTATGGNAAVGQILRGWPWGDTEGALKRSTPRSRAFGSRRPLIDLGVGVALSIVAYWGFTKLGVGLGQAFPPASWSWPDRIIIILKPGS